MFEYSDILWIGHSETRYAAAAAVGATFSFIGIRYFQGARSLRELRLKAIKGEENFRILVQGVRDTAIYMLDLDGCVSNWNPGAERAKGYNENEIIGRHFSCFYTEEDQNAGLPAKNLMIAAVEGIFEGEGWRVRKDGSMIWAHIIIEPLRSSKGVLIGYAKITRDHTQKMRAEKRLQKTSADLNLALTYMANGIALFDANGRLTLHNERIYEILEIESTVFLTGMSLADICGHNRENATKRLSAYEDLIKQGGGEATTELPNGKLIRVVCSPTTTGAWVISIEDITERARSERSVAHMALHDPLTGLPNRRQFIETLDRVLSRATMPGTKVALFNIDLDRFKEINDTFGHASGDIVLNTLAARFKKMIGEGEMVGRFGGDEFMAMKEHRTTDEFDDFLGRLNHVVTDRMQVGAAIIEPGASIGVSTFPADAGDREKLMSNADMAMYRVKKDPTETVCFYNPSMDEARRIRLELARDIWTALKEDQFFLCYQVQKKARTLDVAGYEVLLRWQHPKLGLVPPGDFIPIAEECGAISAIGDWVLERACGQAANWTSGTVAVNLSPVQLSNIDLPNRIRQILLKTGMAAARLELEVTETAIIVDKKRALHILRQIKAMGVTIAIDDFGTGYSSLETLRSFPFDKIKLDRSFVIDLDTNIHARAFVRAMLALGKSLRIPVLAEGVETEEQMNVLTEEGCDQLQGYLLGRPAPMPDLGVKALNVGLQR